MLKCVSKGVLLSLLAILLAGLFAVPVAAFDARAGDNITVAAGEVVRGDLYAAGSDIIINGTVDGDVFAAGLSLTINGSVSGGVTFAGQTLALNGNVTHGVRFAGQTATISGEIGRDLVVAGAEVTITGQGNVEEDLLLAVGTAKIDGRVGGNIKGGGDNITIAAEVGGDIKLRVESLRLTSTAEIAGDLDYTSDNEAEIQSGANIGGTTIHSQPAWDRTWYLPALAGAWILWQIFAFLMILVAGIIIILFAGHRVAHMADSIKSHPWESLGWGALLLFVTPVAAILVMITIIGIPVALIALVLYAIAIYLAQIPVALLIGRLITRPDREKESKVSMIGALALGLLILLLLRLIPFVGWLVSLGVILFGLGSLVSSRNRANVAA